MDFLEYMKPRCGLWSEKEEEGMLCVRVFTGRLPLASWSKLLQTEARGKITIETANSFRHMITQPLNTMRFNSLYFAVIEVKHISCEKQFMSSFSGKRAFVWKENSRKILSFWGKAAALQCAWKSSQKSRTLNNTKAQLSNWQQIFLIFLLCPK